LPFVTIVVVAIVLRQRIRDRVPDVYTLDDGDEVPTTEPRWRAGAQRQPRPHRDQERHYAVRSGG
jgi:hypothetical protein